MNTYIYFQGDSGGPLICLDGDRYYAAGVTSYGWAHCRWPRAPSVYTRVSHYIDWITVLTGGMLTTHRCLSIAGCLWAVWVTG